MLHVQCNKALHVKRSGFQGGVLLKKLKLLLNFTEQDPSGEVEVDQAVKKFPLLYET